MRFGNISVKTDSFAKTSIELWKRCSTYSRPLCGAGSPQQQQQKVERIKPAHVWTVGPNAQDMLLIGDAVSSLCRRGLSVARTVLQVEVTKQLVSQQEVHRFFFCPAGQRTECTPTSFIQASLIAWWQVSLTADCSYATQHNLCVRVIRATANLPSPGGLVTSSSSGSVHLIIRTTDGMSTARYRPLG